MAVLKIRVGAFILYPESVPSDWQEIIHSWHLPVLVSPLHDSDVDDNGELKKPHYHVLFWFDGPTTMSSVLEMVSPLGITYVEKVRAKSVYERYLCHLDDPDKFQYPIAGIQSFGGAVPSFLIESEFHDGFTALTRLIEDEGILLYADLARLIAFEYPESSDVLNRYSSHFNNYCRSRFDAVRFSDKMVKKPDNLSYVNFRVHFENRA